MKRKSPANRPGFSFYGDEQQKEEEKEILFPLKDRNPAGRNKAKQVFCCLPQRDGVESKRQLQYPKAKAPPSTAKS